ncbi:MAG: glycosyltransferase [Bacteroidetes bacterium]|nr:glycosyltransferase [Bacteroidota bacterium]
MKKKLIFTVTNDLTYDQRMIRICSSLAQNGYDVLLVGRKRSFSKQLSKSLPFQQKRISCFFNKGKLFYLEYNLRLFFFLFFSKFDLICSIDLDTILPGFIISNLRDKIGVYDAHEYFTELPEVINRPLVKKIWNWVANRTIPKLKYAYTVGNGLAGIFEKQYGVQFDVIRNVPLRGTILEGLDLEKSFKPYDNSNKAILLYQGALNDGRGLEEVIEAMPKIQNAELWLVGEGDLSQVLRKKAKNLGLLENGIHFLGYKTPKELKEITLKATVGLNLLQNKGLNYYYSLANKAFDYIQAGIPSVNMEFPEYQHINKETEVFYLITDLEKETLANAIIQLLSNRVLYKKLRKNCLAARERFIWENEEIKLLKFYENVFE